MTKLRASVAKRCQTRRTSRLAEFVRGATYTLSWLGARARRRFGRPPLRARLHNAAGELIRNFDWITLKKAEEMAEALGVELEVV
jgi:hypothetical protein